MCVCGGGGCGAGVGVRASAGLEKAKSLLEVKGKDTFIDFIAQQIIR